MTGLSSVYFLYELLLRLAQGPNYKSTLNIELANYDTQRNKVITTSLVWHKIRRMSIELSNISLMD